MHGFCSFGASQVLVFCSLGAPSKRPCSVIANPIRGVCSVCKYMYYIHPGLRICDCRSRTGKGAAREHRRAKGEKVAEGSMSEQRGSMSEQRESTSEH